MEPQFIVNTTIDAPCQLEASRALASKFSKNLTYIFFGLIVIILGVVVWQYILNPNTSSLSTMLILVLAIGFLLYTHFRAPKTALRRWEQGLLSRFGTTAMHVRTEFFDKILVQSMQESDNIVEEGYSVITEMRESKNYILLRCGRRDWFFLAKNGFEVGTPEAFGDFIRARIGGLQL
ncbi:MAG: hypothetical protein LBM28_03455 [Oscillospiraceae bacterium]|jgi:hypothetical protein|nr:hypothetical protein [Oscillospiraceae bacterium]